VLPFDNDYRAQRWAVISVGCWDVAAVRVPVSVCVIWEGNATNGLVLRRVMLLKQSRRMSKDLTLLAGE
jgi:multidrug transporter EmrE-like cation transporter